LSEYKPMVLKNDGMFIKKKIYIGIKVDYNWTFLSNLSQLFYEFISKWMHFRISVRLHPAFGFRSITQVPHKQII
jgi:hypothetical protein